eukprot:jgi/Mesen1/1476/ME000132S00423
MAIGAATMGAEAVASSSNDNKDNDSGKDNADNDASSKHGSGLCFPVSDSFTFPSSASGSASGSGSVSDSAPWRSFREASTATMDDDECAPAVPLEGLEEWTLDLEKLFLGPRFASGAFGKVYMGQYGAQEVAVKILRQPALEESRQKLERQFKQEFVGACHRPPVWCLATEYLHGGNLRAFLHQQREAGHLPLPTAVHMSLDIARGMEFLHSRGIVHRDLKSENLLLTQGMSVKVADFGVSRMEGAPADMTAESGTYRWMAPEMIEHQPYNRAVDVYSFGLVMWELLMCEVPFEGMSSVQAAFAVVNKVASSDKVHMSLSCSPLFGTQAACWRKSAMQRPTFKEVVRELEEIKAYMSEDASKLALPSKSLKRSLSRIPSRWFSRKSWSSSAQKK